MSTPMVAVLITLTAESRVVDTALNAAVAVVLKDAMVVLLVGVDESDEGDHAQR